MIQESLLDWVPPVKGETFDEIRDGKRLGDQYLRVRAFMIDGHWYSLQTISAATGDPQASVSARLRDMRRDGFKVERKHVGNGLHLYRAIRQEAECPSSNNPRSGSGPPPAS